METNIKEAVNTLELPPIFYGGESTPPIHYRNFLAFQGAYDTRNDVIYLSPYLGEAIAQVFLHELVHSCSCFGRVGYAIPLEKGLNYPKLSGDLLFNEGYTLTDGHISLAVEEHLADYVSLVLLRYYGLSTTKQAKEGALLRMNKYLQVLEPTGHLDNLLEPICARFKFITGEELEPEMLNIGKTAV